VGVVQREVGTVQVKDRRYAVALELIRGVLEKKVSKLIARGSATISSREIFRLCLEKYDDEDKCAVATSYAAHLLNRLAKRVASHKARWLVSWGFFEMLCGTPYSDLRDTPLSSLDAYCFYYVITALLYAKPVEGDADGNGG
jgi:hypothetical protein